MSKIRKNISKEECARRMRIALEAKGINYDDYISAIEQKKNNPKKEEYRFVHEDNTQFGFSFQDVMDFSFNSWSF